MKEKNIGNVFLVLTLFLTLIGIPTEVNAEAVKTAAELQASVVPILQEYDARPEDGVWKVNGETRFVLENTDENRNNERLKEVIDLISAEYLEKEIPTKAIELDKVLTDKKDITENDIHVNLGEAFEITDKTDSREAYKIEINEDGLVITAASENAVLHALRTILHLSLTQDGIAYGTIVDFPDVEERRVHVDMGRKYFTKDWMIQHIRELSYLKMNTLQMHFSENMGFRIESDVAPEIVSDQHLTKEEVREIIAEANKYGISIIPSFDTPGHTEHILKSHPEFGQIDINGKHSDVALDVTNPEAVQFVHDLLDEYMDLFEGSKHFHLGADEYMEFDRNPFQSDYMPVLNDYAKETLGEEYNWKDVMATYINNMAEHVYERGFKPRIFNDGIYYGGESSPAWAAAGAPQTLEIHKYIGIDFWSQMGWNPAVANLQTFIDNGHEDIYNLNSGYFYYVLRPSKPDDGREQHSFDYLNQDIRIFDEWTPGKFASNTISDDHPSIRGASLAIWNDVPDLVTEDVITDDISKELRSLATKSWNVNSNELTNIEGFRKTYALVGNVPAFEKGSTLPDTEDFKEVNTDKAAAEEVDRLIAKFKEADEVTEEYRMKVKAAREAYDALSEEAKALVHPANIGKLERAEAKIADADNISDKKGWVKEGSDWYYYDENGDLLTDWTKVNNVWYYLNENGVMQTDWQKVNGTWYYMNSSGAMQTGWTKVNNTWYYLNPNGAMQIGWTKVNNTWYYLNSNGAMQTGWVKVNNIWYYLNSNGAMQTGWMKVNNTWYYLNSNGAMQTDWVKVNNIWYYLNSNGAMQTGWVKVNSTWYYLNSNGAMQTDWVKVNHTWYYMNSNGAMQIGWLKLGNHWYYLNTDGSMQIKNTWINGTWYRFDASGRML